MKIEHKIEVRFRDIDSMGHVNNAVYLRHKKYERCYVSSKKCEHKNGCNK